MTTFENREKAHEAKFAFDEETAFKITARRNRLLGLWLAEKLGMSGQAAEEYARNTIAAGMAGANEEGVVGKILAELKSKGIAVPADEIRQHATTLLETVRAEFKKG